MTLVISLLIFVLSFISGMLGLGVAFVAIPVLGLFGLDLIHVIMPLALLLNGLTSVSGAIAFLRRKMVDLRLGLPLLAICTAAAPLGVYLLRFVSTTTVWWVFVAALVFIAARMIFPPKMSDKDEVNVPPRNKAIAMAAGFFIAVLAGFLGVGPGFLMMPTLVLVGYPARLAAATNALIVTLPSFSAFLGHLGTARVDPVLLASTSVAGVAGAWLGAVFMAKKVRSRTLAMIFGFVLIGLAIQRVWLLLT
ncbi:MAG: sulfite exporter TauE/SafE family protein [Clostridia bacterium]|nr:sulfite exporter TauE/SafE family protein [Clostridia bacterium]